MVSESPFDLAGKRVWVAGHRGMVGSALVRRLDKEDCTLIATSSAEVDLTDPVATDQFVGETRPDAAFIAAARVGGILANDMYPADFLDINLMIAANTIRAAHRHGVAKLLYLGSSCIYPKEAVQPISEEALLTGPLEPTNEAYAIAKIAGIRLCQAYRRQHGCDFISAMPCNLYGPGDTYDAEGSHVIPALMLKALSAKEAGQDWMEIWGSGTPRREFLHADDCADALVLLMKVYSDASHVNVGSGEDIAIADLARMVMDIAGMKGELRRDTSKPDGTMRKLMDTSKLSALGWVPRIDLRTGLSDVWQSLAAG